ncbi:hypothetical protein B0H10DRAFT_1966220 [Mycena sp. CBHHK59/15]|nr:hypothetical protein B0H10DRAFT_1966220 [Mycena sp. CBHHK59/15]
MAEEVWESLASYGLEGRIIAFVMDNATNNDTMIEVFEQKCEAKGINFSAMDSRNRGTNPGLIYVVIRWCEIGGQSLAASYTWEITRWSGGVGSGSAVHRVWGAI